MMGEDLCDPAAIPPPPATPPRRKSSATANPAALRGVSLRKAWMTVRCAVLAGATNHGSPHELPRQPPHDAAGCYNEGRFATRSRQVTLTWGRHVVTKTYRGALLLALVIGLLAPSAAAAAVPSSVTKGLDWLHTRQRSGGGLSYTSSSGNPYDTPWVMLAIAAGHNGPSRWTINGHSPVTFLQGIALDTAAKNSGNAPEYYALCILAYRAAGRTDLLTTAGSTQIDLISKLESYQSATDGYYSPATPATTDAATETTAFAILGLVAAHQSGPSLSDAVDWLGGEPNTDSTLGAGGFGSSPSTLSSTTVTSLAIQALVAAEGTKAGQADQVVKNAADFIETMQKSDGGFEDTAQGFVNAPSTAWAIEGLNAAGFHPADLGHSPYTFLRSLRQTNGSTYEFPGDIGDVLNATTQATIALSGKTLPITLASKYNVATRFDPSFTSGSVVPKRGARFAGRSVEVRASYHDNANGTGINPSAITMSVDGKSKTSSAHIYASHLYLQLTKLKNGSHTFVIRIRDRAGNDTYTQHSFTIAVPAGGGSTGGGTHPGTTTGSSSSSTSSGTGTRASSTPTPTATISPSQGVSPGVTLTPTASSSLPASGLSTSPSASAVTGQVTGSGGGGGGGGHTAAIVGTALVALVPLGFAASWIVRRNLMGAMAGASRGEILHGGSSVWQRFWKSGGSPPAQGGE